MTETASSGSSGPKVRSDCMVTYSASDARLAVDVETEGDEASLVSGVLEAAVRLGVDTGRILVQDCGAKPWVAAARFEAAVRMILGDVFPVLPKKGDPVASERSMPRRSRLYAPGNMPRFIEKAAASCADGVILDLEDSVAPDRKAEARILTAYALRETDFGRSEIMVRINQGENALDDLAWIVPQPVQHILLPKVENADQVAELRDQVETLMELCGREPFPWLMPIIESPEGIFNARDIAQAVPEMAALTLGLQDLTAELGVRPTDHGRESFVARSMVVMAARSAGLQPIDTVYADVKDLDGLTRSIGEAKELGFVGKGCIHPDQVEPINRGFLPDRDLLVKAMETVKAMEAAEAEGLGAVALGSKMIDPPVARQARVLVDNAIALGMIGADWRDADQS
jgi:citrate lyase subunit beta/citryl-CoA lyase